MRSSSIFCCITAIYFELQSLMSWRLIKPEFTECWSLLSNMTYFCIFLLIRISPGVSLLIHIQGQLLTNLNLHYIDNCFAFSCAEHCINPGAFNQMSSSPKVGKVSHLYKHNSDDLFER